MPRGVPQHIIDSFPTYSYTASPAQKQDLRMSAFDARNTNTHRPSSPPSADAVVAAAVLTQPPLAAATATAHPQPSALPSAAAANLHPVSNTMLHTDATPSIDNADTEEPCCTVCLCEYEPGDQIRRLHCNHDFHQVCIDKWMASHTTCPCCRLALVPEQDLYQEFGQATGSGIEMQPMPHGSSLAWSAPLLEPEAHNGLVFDTVTNSWIGVGVGVPVQAQGSAPAFPAAVQGGTRGRSEETPQVLRVREGGSGSQISQPALVHVASMTGSQAAGSSEGERASVTAPWHVQLSQTHSALEMPSRASGGTAATSRSEAGVALPAVASGTPPPSFTRASSRSTTRVTPIL